MTDPGGWPLGYSAAHQELANNTTANRKLFGEGRVSRYNRRNLIIRTSRC